MIYQKIVQMEVRFSLSIMKDSQVCLPEQEIQNFDEALYHINNYYKSQKPFAFRITLYRYEKEVGADKKAKTNEHALFETPFKTSEKPVDFLPIIVSEKVPTVANIRRYLKRKYQTTYDFNPKKEENRRPAMLVDVVEQQSIGLFNPETYRPSINSFHHVLWHPLRQAEDIVMTTKGKQIYGDKSLQTELNKFFYIPTIEKQR